MIYAQVPWWEVGPPEVFEWPTDEWLSDFVDNDDEWEALMSHMEEWHGT